MWSIWSAKREAAAATAVVVTVLAVVVVVIVVVVAHQMSAVTVLIAVHLLWCIQSCKNMWRLKTWGTARIFISLREKLCEQI